MSSIKVAVRCRPLFELERAATGLDIQSRRILLDSKTYDPDYTFPPSATQEDLFAVCRPILQCVKDGLNGTLMVYGQTGTGKTYTMLGNDGEDDGLVHKVIAHMLEHVQQKTMEGSQCALTLSMVEIYNERLTDMLSPNGDEEVTLISGFPRFTHKVTLCRLGDANEAVRQGLAWRHTAATQMNERSSRSHVVFIVDLEEFNAFTEQTDVAHLFLVDLAGSESLKKSQATGTVASEAGKINKSLLALKSVFLALSNTNEATRPGHVPYRDSRLTELLQDSIGGTARTLLIACISSVGRDIEETKSTLMYAVKARSIRNAANTEKEKLLIRLRSMEVENQRLRNRLQERVYEKGGYYITKEDHERNQQMEEEVNELRTSVDQLVKDTQASDARKHISESQTKILQGLVQDREEELQRFKVLYHDALGRFENHATVLHKVVSAGVGEVKRIAHGDAEQSFSKLQSWRAAMVRLLDAAAGDYSQQEEVDSTTSGGGCGGAPSLAASPPMAAPPLIPAAVAVPPPSARGSVVNQQRGSQRTSVQQQQQQQQVTTTNSPSSRKGRRKPLMGGAPSLSSNATTDDVSGGSLPPLLPAARRLELNNGNEETEATAAVAASSPSPSNTQPLLLSADFLQLADDDCRRVVDRINDTVKSLVKELDSAYAASIAASKQVADRRRAALEGICSELRRQVESSIGQAMRLDASTSRDLEDIQGEFAGRVAVAKQCPLPADVHPFQQMVRQACLATVSSAERAFPTPSVADAVVKGLDGIAGSHRQRMTSMTVSALEPLGSIAGVPANPTDASSALSSPRFNANSSQPQTTVFLSGSIATHDMPPLAPTAPLSASRSAPPPSPPPPSRSTLRNSVKENIPVVAGSSPMKRGDAAAATSGRISLRSSNNGNTLQNRTAAPLKRTRSALSASSSAAEDKRPATASRFERKRR